MNSIAVDSSEQHEARMQSPSANANNSFAIHESTRQWVHSCATAVNIVVSVVLSVLLWDAYRNLGDRITKSLSAKEQIEDLKRYDLDFFKQNDWAQIKTQVEINKQLIEAYGLQKSVRER